MVELSGLAELPVVELTGADCIQFLICAFLKFDILQ